MRERDPHGREYEMTYEQKIAKAAKSLVKGINIRPENYRKNLRRRAECIADEFDMSLKSVEHEINALVDELM